MLQRTAVPTLVFVAALFTGCRATSSTARPVLVTAQARAAASPAPAPIRVGPAPAAAGEGPQVFLEIRTLALRAGALPHLVADAEQAGPWQRLCRLGECEELWAELRRSRAEVLSAPHLLCLPGHEATLFLGEEPTGRLDDWTGLRIATTPHLMGDGQELRLDLDARRRAGSGEQRITVTGVRLASSDTLLLVSSKPDGAGSPRFAVLVTPQILRPESGKAPVSPAKPVAVLFEATLLQGLQADVANLLGTATPAPGQAWRTVPVAAYQELETAHVGHPDVERLVLPSLVSSSEDEFVVEVCDTSAPGPWSGIRAWGQAAPATDGRSLTLDYAAFRRVSAAAGATERRAEVTGATLHADEALVLASPVGTDDRRMVMLLRATTLPGIP